MTLFIVGLILVAVVVIGSILCMGGRESQQERERKPFPPATGLPCHTCGVLESAHKRITGHPFEFGP